MDIILEKIRTQYPNKDRCFVLGNGPSLNKVDLTLLKNEVTIACNTFLEGLDERGDFFLPTILCGGDACMIRDFIRNRFQFDNKNTYDKIKDKMVYVFHASSLIRNCYEIENWQPLCTHYNDKCNCKLTRPCDIKMFYDIMENNKNIYLIKQFDPPLLCQDVYELIGKNKTDSDKKTTIINNYTYCTRYHNVIPMISLFLALHLNFKYVYLLGCDGIGFDKHFYNAMTGVTTIDDKSVAFKTKYYGDIYNAINDRKIEFISKGRIIINGSQDSVYDCLPIIDFPSFVNTYDGDINLLCDSYHKYSITNLITPDHTKKTIIQRPQQVYSKNPQIQSNNVLNTIKSKLKRTDRCFILGNGPSLKTFNLSLLKNEVTIACNFFMEGCNYQFIPSILCGGCAHYITKTLDEHLTSQYNITKDRIIRIYSPSALINACYDISNWSQWQNNTDVIKYNTQSSYVSEQYIRKLKSMMDNDKNIYLINNFNDFNLTQNIYDMIGASQFDRTKSYLINENLKYCNTFKNIIPMISLLIAQQLEFKFIYLIGCDGNNFDTHFYSNKFSNFTIGNEKDQYYTAVYNAFREKYNSMADFSITSLVPTSFDFIKTIDANKLKIPQKLDLINAIDTYCKIEHCIKHNIINKELFTKHNLAIYYIIQKLLS